MNTMKNLLIAESLLEGRVSGFRFPEFFRMEADVQTDTLLDAVRMLFNTEWGNLKTITLFDGKRAGDRAVILYHFNAGEAVVTLRLAFDKETESLPSIRTVVPAAEIYERELAGRHNIRVGD